MAMLAFYDRHRYAFLFYVLLVALCVPPITSAFGIEGRVMEALLAGSLLAAVAASGTGRMRLLALITVLFVVAVRFGADSFDQQEWAHISLGGWGVMALLAAASALRHALRGQSVGSEQIYAALSTYLLVGMFFGLLYWLVEQIAPGSLTIGGAVVVDGISVATTTYFSFVTLASLGYGDVLPVSEVARGLAVVEVVGGQLYLAVMVARLVSAWR